MIIYNVTVKTDWSIHDEWLQWMQQEHIPEILATHMFFDYKIMRLLNIDDSEGPTYAIQYHAHNKEDYDRYITQYAPALQEKGLRKWGNRYIAFRSLMQIVN